MSDTCDIESDDVRVAYWRCPVTKTPGPLTPEDAFPDVLKRHLKKCEDPKAEHPSFTAMTVQEWEELGHPSFLE